MVDISDCFSRAARWLPAAGMTALLATALACSPGQPPEPSEPEVEDGAAAEAAPAAPIPEWQQRIDDIEPMVEAWAKDWSRQSVPGYLFHYSPDFQTPDGMPREAWEELRRQRLTQPSEIRVRVFRLQRSRFNSGYISGKQRELVSVRFRQTYRSDTYSDEVWKELELELVDGAWKIFRETTL